MRTGFSLQSLLVLCLGLFFVVGCRNRGGAIDDGIGQGTLYTRTAMRATADKSGTWQMKSTNFIDAPKLLRVGTQLVIRKMGSASMELTDNEGARYKVGFEKKHNMMSFDAWRERQFSSGPVSLPDGLTELERRCIDEGRVEVGMSRAAVFLAIGYPPASLSPDLKARSLVYQAATFNRRRFDFDDNDIVSAIGE